MFFKFIFYVIFVKFCYGEVIYVVFVIFIVFFKFNDGKDVRGLCFDGIILFE